MASNPYEQQLRSFTSSTSNARRGLTDLYKLRKKGIEADYNYKNKLYGSAVNKTNEQYGASQDALEGFGRGALGGVQAGGYDTDRPEVDAAVKGIIGQGTSPYAAYLKSEQGAQTDWYKGYKGAAQYENKTLKTGLAREKPAALSELEQGIIDVSSNLQAQSGAYTQQQQFLQQQQNFMQQMLQAQGGGNSDAAGQGGGDLRSGGLSAAERFIIGKESSGRTTADNPTSTAFGLGQLLISNRQAYGRKLGFNPNTTDYGQQLAMMRAYIADRYGTAEAAMRFWQQHHWY